MNYLVAMLLLLSPIHPQTKPSTPEGWRSVEACRLTFLIPVSASLTNDLGIDSCVREFRAKDVLIALDVTVGYTSNDLRNFRNENAGKSQFHLSETIVGGRKALVVTFYDAEVPEEAAGLNYVSGLFVPEMGKRPGSLWMWVYSRNPEGQIGARKIFESIRFGKR